MTGNFLSMRVHCGDGGLEFLGRDGHIRFPRSHSLGYPIVDGSVRVLWPAERMQLRDRGGSPCRYGPVISKSGPGAFPASMSFLIFRSV